jgi:hypothetical protein
MYILCQKLLHIKTDYLSSQDTQLFQAIDTSMKFLLFKFLTRIVKPIWPSIRFYLYYLTGVSCIIESREERREKEGRKV